MKLKIALLALLVAITLTACGQNKVESEAVQAKPLPNIKQLVHDYSVGNMQHQSASITAKQLIISDEEEKLVYDLPEDEFFVSIAPYISQTHPCTYHSLTGCQGELVNKKMDIHLEDSEGNVILHETLATGANGFIDLWLPRDKTYNITITYDGKEAQSSFSTFESDGTCITNIQLL